MTLHEQIVADMRQALLDTIEMLSRRVSDAPLKLQSAEEAQEELDKARAHMATIGIKP